MLRIGRVMSVTGWASAASVNFTMFNAMAVRADAADLPWAWCAVAVDCG